MPRSTKLMLGLTLESFTKMYLGKIILPLNFFKQINSRSVSWEWDGVNVSGVGQC